MPCLEDMNDPTIIGIPDGAVRLTGEWRLPKAVHGVILFAHGSGSNRSSRRNRRVAETLRAKGYGTLLFDLLTEAEDRELRFRFDIDRLARRLVAATRWAAVQEEAVGMPLGYFGASTGAAAALRAAADLGPMVGAVVSRGGRPDLAAGSLARILAPTLLIVGAQDPEVLELNREAALRLRCPNRLTVIPGASHLFEEPGTLEEVQRLATEWFDRYLPEAAPPPAAARARNRGGGAASAPVARR